MYKLPKSVEDTVGTFVLAFRALGFWGPGSRGFVAFCGVLGRV